MTSYSTQLVPKREYGFNGSGRRAAYALISKNGTGSNASISWFDENFASVSGANRSMQGTSLGNMDMHAIAWGHAYGGTNPLMNQISATQTNVSSNWSGSCIGATPNIGEFGSSLMDCFSDGNFQGTSQRPSTEKHYLNAGAIMSDHSDKSTVYILIGGKIRAISRLWGGYQFSKAGTVEFTVPGLNTNMVGTACYHKARKELTIISYKTTTTVDVITYGNVDFNLYPSPNAALNAGGVTVTSAVLTLGDMNSSYNESIYRIMPTVSNDGTLWLTTMIPTVGLKISKTTRNDTSAISALSLATLASHGTTYGIEQGNTYGQRRLTSRDGTVVACYSPFYYCGSGGLCFMVDITNNTYAPYNYNNSGDGLQVLPYKDAGFAFYQAGNLYADNYATAPITAIFERGDSTSAANNTLRQTQGTKFLPYQTQYNTTNYPGLIQVTDYSMLLRDSAGELYNPYGSAF